MSTKQSRASDNNKQHSYARPAGPIRNMSESLNNSSAASSPARRKPRKLEMRGSRSGISVDLTNASDMEFATREHHEGELEDDALRSFSREDDQLPVLPVDEHSYFKDETPSFMHRSDEPSGLPAHSDDLEGEGASLDERAMRRHLMDDESSFLPETAPAPAVQHDLLGVDDTYVQLGKPGRTPPPDAMLPHLTTPVLEADRRHMMGSRDQPPMLEDEQEEHQLQTPESTDRSEEHMETYDSQGKERSMSPAAAAAQRSHSRNVSTGSVLISHPQRATSYSMQSDDHTPATSRPSSPATPSQRTGSRASTLRPDFSPRAQDIPLPQSEFDSSMATSTAASPRRLRPGFLSSRQVSQISSRSTATMSSEFSGSDTTVGADYALQTGGARPGSSSLNGSVRHSNFMNRMPSLGSDVSFITRDGDNFPTLGRLANGFTRERLPTRYEEEEPETPRANTARNDAPTDTVLAQRVESIQVPETIARDFRARHPSLGTDRRPASSDGPGTAAGERPRKALTLKEQNGKIDKLSKENFDLKLKIHFLDQALRSHSDEGLQELIDKNVQYQTDLANERKESQSLRRKMRELERKTKELEAGLENAMKVKHSARDDASDDEDPTLQAEMHEEILYLRQQLDHSENTVTTLREEMVTEKFEKRKMAEHMRSMAGTRPENNSGVRETMDMWQDLLNAETGRREQAEEDARKLREELTNMRIERASPVITRADKRMSRGSRLSHVQSFDDESEYTNGVNGSESSHTLVEQLKHENAELRRDLGAQTSMLTSRNRERERLQQEIEDLKLLQRKSDGSRSVAGDSIFERSISRAHQRAPSRVSDHTAVTEAERDDWDKKEGQLRDQNAELRLKFQELERTHNTHLQYVSALEGDFQEMEQELNDVNEDLKALVVERDDALQSSEELQAEYERLEQEAVGEIDKLEKEAETLHTQLQDALKKAQRTQTKLEHATDGYKGLQGELREITQSVMNLEDEKQANMRTIETLEQQIGETEDELQKWEEKCKELDQKNRKLEITQESLHSEITFLREEQEGDKIKIGELEDALNAAEQNIQDEQEKLKELEDEIVQERQQRDVLENKSKEEVQKVLDDLNTDGAKSKDEVRKLRRALSAKEVEAGTWKQRLEDLEQSFRHALGDLSGTKQSMLGDIEKLQRDLESTATQLDRTKMDAADKDRLLRHRDGLLESTSLESRRLSDLLDKERSARKHDLEQFERSSRGQATHMRTIAHHESRVLELETAFSQDKRKMAALEQQYREQLSDRNTLLLALWNRLSTVCGTEWATNHSLISGEVPSTEVIGRSLPAFNKNIIAAVKKIEHLMGDFKLRIRSVEKDLWKDYQTLEHNLDLRIRRMDGLERAVHEAQARLAEQEAQHQQRPQANRSVSTRSINVKGTEEIGKLKSEVKILKAELKFHRQHPSAMAQQMLHQERQQGLHPMHARRLSSGGSGSSLGGKPPSPARTIMNQLLRHHSSSAVEQMPSAPLDLMEQGNNNSPLASIPQSRSQSIQLATPPIQPSEQRWIHRLKEMERRLKAEREARLLDRRGARQRLEEGRAENEELRILLDRERRGSVEFDEGVGVEEE